ncbi:hypothetical protein [Streptomyces sp. NPDC059491]|uniref:hypothetical protein n=1 Tax=unclassified Streptomyces TaxID=2593676 RepID=UPI00367AE459
MGSSFAVLGLGALPLITTDPAAVVLYVVVGAAGLWVACRSLVMGVRIDAAGLTERGLGRSKVFPWCAISAVQSGGGPGVAAPTQAPQLLLRDGRQAGLGALASYSGHVVEADFVLIKSLHATHTADCPNCA